MLLNRSAVHKLHQEVKRQEPEWSLQDRINEIVWIYAGMQEINVEDVELLETDHAFNLRLLASGDATPPEIADVELCRYLGLLPGSTFVECIAHVLDSVFDTDGEHLEAIRASISRRQRESCS